MNITSGVWIQSARYDCILFMLSPLAGLLLVLAVLHSPAGELAAILVTLFLVFPHYISSFSFYLGDENWGFSKNHWIIYLAVPALILTTVFSLRVFGGSDVLRAVIIIWNVYHVSQQSSGILSVYRKLNGGLSTEKVWAQRTFLCVNASMAFWFLERTRVVNELVLWANPLAPDVLRYALVVGAAYCAFRYLFEIRKRPHKLKPQELLFLASSLLLFHPFLWVEDSALATLAMLTGHVIEYLGFIWLLNRRKYTSSSGSTSQRLLHRVSRRGFGVVLFCFTVGLIFAFLDYGSRAIGFVLPFWILANTVALTHFYVDGLIWAFKKPFVMRTVGPYFFPPTRAKMNTRIPTDKKPTESIEYSRALLALLKQSEKKVTSRIKGTSMGSSLPDDAEITVTPTQNSIYQKGQVVAFLSGKSLVAHRIVYVGTGKLKDVFLTRGDNCLYCDSPIEATSILGVVQSYTLNSLKHSIPPYSCNNITRRIILTFSTRGLVFVLYFNRDLARLTATKFAGFTRRLISLLSSKQL